MIRTGCGKIRCTFICLLMVAGLTLAGCTEMPLVSHLLGRAEKTALPEVAFSDDFSDPKSGWDRLQSPLGMTDYRKDAYQMLVTAPSTDLFANPGLSFKDVIVEVTAARLDGPDSNNYGVICRYKDEKNFYAAQISSSGYGGIFRMRNGVYKVLGDDQMQPAPAVLGGGATNRIRFECLGSTLRLVVNGALVDEREDNHFEIGDVGLIAGTYDQPGVHIAFDDFMVAQP